jgi:hypothetical protein
MPRTGPGKWSLWLITAFVALFAIFWLVVATGQRGGERFFDNLLLTVPILLAGIAGIASLFTGLVGVIRYRERSILVYPAMAIGLFVLLFVVGEIAFPH